MRLRALPPLVCPLEMRMDEAEKLDLIQLPANDEYMRWTGMVVVNAAMYPAIMQPTLDEGKRSQIVLIDADLNLCPPERDGTFPLKEGYYIPCIEITHRSNVSNLIAVVKCHDGPYGGTSCSACDDPNEGHNPSRAGAMPRRRSSPRVDHDGLRSRSDTA